MHDSTRRQLIELLQLASKLIATQLHIDDCTSNGKPCLGEARCQGCHQLSACSWCYHSTPLHALDRVPDGDLTRDFALALMLIDRYLDVLAFTPEEHERAKDWLNRARPFSSSLAKT